MPTATEGSRASVAAAVPANVPAIELKAVRFAWPGTARPVISIDAFSVGRGERLFLQGPSGSGKSTLLALIGAIVQPLSGRVWVDGVDVARLDGRERDRFRADTIGIVFQQFNLLPFLSVGENVRLSCRFSPRRRERLRESGRTPDEETLRLLDALQLSPDAHAGRRASSLSVGQQQRVAVARALIGRPPVVIADEPTSALDTNTRDAFLELLFAEVEAAGATLLFVSHDAALAMRFDRTVDLESVNRR